MASPTGAYTPKTGELAGQTYRSYFAYQQARAQTLGFSNYSEQRRVTGQSIVQTLIARTMAVKGISRNDATRQVRIWYQSQGYRGRSARAGADHSRNQGRRKADAIKWAIENGLYDTGDDAADEIPY